MIGTEASLLVELKKNQKELFHQTERKAENKGRRRVIICRIFTTLVIPGTKCSFRVMEECLYRFRERCETSRTFNSSNEELDCTIVENNQKAKDLTHKMLKKLIVRLCSFCLAVFLLTGIIGNAQTKSPMSRTDQKRDQTCLPTGVCLDAAGDSFAVGNMPLGAVVRWATSFPTGFPFRQH